MSTHTTLALPNKSLGLNLTPDLSPSKRHKSYAPRSTSDPISLKRMPSPLLLPSKSWSKSNFNSQTLARSQCPRMHYCPWCDNCQTLMGWEPPQPIKLKSTRSILPFGDLKMVVWARSHFWSPFATQTNAQRELKKVCSEWRNEQFTRAVAKRSGQHTAWEELRWQAHQQRMDCGVRPQA